MEELASLISRCPLFSENCHSQKDQMAMATPLTAVPIEMVCCLSEDVGISANSGNCALPMVA